MREMRKLPQWIEVRRDESTASWLLACRACKIRERYHNYWNASRAAHDHADMHEETDPVTSAGEPS